MAARKTRMAISLRLATSSLRMGRGSHGLCAEIVRDGGNGGLRLRGKSFVRVNRHQVGRYFGQDRRQCKARYRRGARGPAGPYDGGKWTERFASTSSMPPRADVREAAGRLYADVQGEVEARRPVCVVSGRCCRFEEFGHRLFVTTMEMGAFLHGLGPQTNGQASTPWDGTGCPFQVRKLCGVHAIRPFGCRMFFCDATSTEWQNQAYERFHAALEGCTRN